MQLNSILAKGYKYQLITRFNESADYVMTYGNASARKPVYDITKFKKNIPENPKKLSIGDEVEIEKNQNQKASPLFENKYWLWAVMIVINANQGLVNR